ncbi:MAG: HAMP domain-containing histidine kinase [Lachnospiraceae bacterium]|jgi:signal transduction histidine kinase|nr:HAMP domain-containing histidine kinase [Lachnospiraceae bacterium]
MKNRLTKLMGRYFGAALNLRVRLFNVLAIGGAAVSLVMAVLSFANNASVANAVINLVVAALSVALLTYSQRTGRYQVCYMITIAVIFILVFPLLFFYSGGYHGGMPAFFVFAVMFTIFMLEGKVAAFFSIAELALYTAVFFVAYYRPETVRFFASEEELLVDILTAFVTVCVVMGVCMFLHFRIYNEQQRRLDEQNEILTQANRAKTEFLSNVSHEMRTPLTVISVNVQTVAEILDELAVKDAEAGELLKNAQDEVMRLARMVSGVLKLASMSENVDKRRMDLSALLQSGADMLRLNLAKGGSVIETDIEPGLIVFGNADLLAQVLTNLLQNAGAHMENGKARVSARGEGGFIMVEVKDTGTGIAPELLPHVFERGVSTGGTGFGLYLCRTVIETHGGKIWIESEPGRGTAVFYTLPVYEGQFGGDRK